MTTHSAGASEDPRRLLSSTRELAHGVRQAQRATWFPLLVLAAVTFASIPVDRFAHRTLTCRSFNSDSPLPGRVCTVSSTAVFIYWPIALVLAYLVISAMYLRHSKQRGVGTRIQPYVVAGSVLAVVLTIASIWAVHHPFTGRQDLLGLHLQSRSDPDLYRLLSPASAIGLGLLILAWVERNWSLAVVAIGYLIIVLTPITFGWVVDHPTMMALNHPSPWAFLPRIVIDGTVLLVAGIGFALVQRAPSQIAE